MFEGTLALKKIAFEAHAQSKPMIKSMRENEETKKVQRNEYLAVAETRGVWGKGPTGCAKFTIKTCLCRKIMSCFSKFAFFVGILRPFALMRMRM